MPPGVVVGGVVVGGVVVGGVVVGGVVVGGVVVGGVVVGGVVVVVDGEPQLINTRLASTITDKTMNKIFFIIFLSFLLLVIGKSISTSIFRYSHLLPAEQPVFTSR
jgi:hypothetical protein